MKLVDILPIENWVEIEQQINRQSGLNAAVYDVAGVKLLELEKWPDQRCPALRETEKVQQFICAVAHRNIAARTIKTGETVVDECDAGLVKLAVPIFVEDEILGAVLKP